MVFEGCFYYVPGGAPVRVSAGAGDMVGVARRRRQSACGVPHPACLAWKASSAGKFN